MKFIVSFAYNVHDSSVTVANEEKVLLVLEAERYFGEKKKRCSYAEMEELIEEAMRFCGGTIKDVVAVSCTAYKNEHLPPSRQNCEWVIKKEIKVLGRRFNALVINHHLAHAAIVYAFGPTCPVRINACDGGGDFGNTHKNYLWENNKIQLLSNQPIHDMFSSRFYDAVSRYIYGSLMCEGKLMALAALGTPDTAMMEFIKEEMPSLVTNGAEKMMNRLRAKFPIRSIDGDQTAYDLAASAQNMFETMRVKSIKEMPVETNKTILSGGATLNISANSRILEEMGPNHELLVPPCCDDTGQSLGCLLYHCYEFLELSVRAALPFLGYSDQRDGEVESLSSGRVEELASFLTAGGIVLLHRGQSEIGPRALGHRSIISLPTLHHHDLINYVIKERDFYRPLAPLVPEEKVSDWFLWSGPSKYMLFAVPARERTKVHAPGICHYDGSARIQTVHKQDDPFLHSLLETTCEMTHCPILINTSLNLRGQPIAATFQESMKVYEKVKSLPVGLFYNGEFMCETWPPGLSLKTFQDKPQHY